MVSRRRLALDTSEEMENRLGSEQKMMAPTSPPFVSKQIVGVGFEQELLDRLNAELLMSSGEKKEIK